MFAASIPLPTKYGVISIITLGSAWIIYQLASGEILKFRWNYNYLFVPTLFLILLPSYFYDPEVSGINSVIAKSVAFILFPFAIFTSDSLFTYSLNRLMHYCFSLSALLVGAYYLYQYSVTDAAQYDHFIHYLNGISPYHRAFMAMHLLYSVVFWIGESHRLCKYSDAIWLVLILPISIALIEVFYLASKTPVIAIFPLIGVIYYCLSAKVNLRRMLHLTVIASGALIIIVALVPSLNQRVMEVIEGGLSFERQNEIKQTSLTLRVEKWKCAIHVISESPIVGVGAGSTKPSLNACYKANRFWGYHVSFNAHNQYLHYGLIFGFLGMGIYIMILIYAFKGAISKKQLLLASMLILIIVCGTTEVIFARQKGIYFVALFFTINQLPLLRSRKT